MAPTRAQLAIWMFRVVPGATKVEVIARPAVEVVGVPTTQDTVIGACRAFFS